MRLAGHTLGTPDHTVPQALRLFRAAGLDAAEVIYQDDYKSGLPQRDRRAALDALKAADDEGLPIIGLTPYTTSINSLDEREWRSGVDEFRGAIETAHLLGADRVRVYAGSWHPGDADHAARWAKLRDALQTLAPEAAQAGVRLCVENHFGTMTQTAAETAALVREVAHPAVRVLYDQTNLTFTHDETFEQAFEVQGGLIGHVHVKDLVFTDSSATFRATETARVNASERSVRSRVIGTGILPWREILAALLRHGYDDLLSIEYEYRWHPQDLPSPEEGFRESAAALRTMLADLAEVKAR
ncbi:Xylose isomerase domain protein TIM barrel [Pseudarthrobacter chlorophenolicus A6]|uniref:Xylose isomerase domain protein TIM barrel n=1 Tax=Pseudarthrobacter chlorophenolicus (strain ATCC 700700 / DSM 12829 / CIP 107037 / JCM 12360 / KCTC 9906 / NCIMB 13794 / A6) TaxID=452863 RepID=B8H753_PSECP|nr:sugar phosphate isomerase/epimerase family protein [Pseudarthrobacter chlorophenolicus]ACL41655.1 Xylose isomerase domain protein TIM barrel [Pseudarthrobacter chlorophenolicus A6]SDQ60555.1 Sugar phosphate isomerase/epimerase [Pseudarthrobacter chlorophenolicus]